MNNCPYEQAIAKLFRLGSKLGNDFQKTAEFLCRTLDLEYQRTTYGIANYHKAVLQILAPEERFSSVAEVDDAWSRVNGHAVSQRRYYQGAHGLVIVVESLYKNPTSLFFDWSNQGAVIANQTLGLEKACDVVDVNNFKRDKQKIYDATNPANKIKPSDGLQKVLLNIMGSLIELKQRESEMICTDGSHYLLSLQHLHDAIHLLESARTRTE